MEREKETEQERIDDILWKSKNEFDGKTVKEREKNEKKFREMFEKEERVIKKAE